MKGSLSQRSPADILCEVQRRQRSGILSLRRDQVARQIFVDAGTRIRFAASNHPAESLTQWFMERGRLSETQLREATLSKAPEELLGTTLARLGLIPRPALAELTEMHVRRVVQEALSMAEGSYDFQEGALPFREQLDEGLMTAEALLEWTRRIGDTGWLRRRLGSVAARLQRGQRPPEGYQRVRLDATEGYIMSRVDGVATAEEICMVSPMGDERTLGALLGLALAGILEMPEGATDLPAPIDADASPGSSTSPRGSQPAAPAAQTFESVPDYRVTAPAGDAPASATPSGPPAATPPQAPAAGPASRPAGVSSATRRPGTARRPTNLRLVTTHGPHARSGTPPRKAIPRPEKPITPMQAAEIEAEMLQRYEQLHTQDLYQVLGMTPHAAADDIRRAYYAMTRRFHPDTFRNDATKLKAEKVFGRITEAYSTLSHMETRRRYDEESLLSRTAGQHHDPARQTETMARMNFRQGKEHYEHGHLAEALSFLQNACDQDPSRPEYFEYLGLTQAKNPRLRKQAEESLDRAIGLLPTEARLYAHLAALYERAGAADKAHDMYKKALQWDPANQAALKALTPDATAKKGLLGGLFSKK